MERAVRPVTDLERDTERQEDAVAQDEQHSGRRGMTGVQNQIPGDQREDGHAEQDEIAAREQRAPDRR